MTHLNFTQINLSNLTVDDNTDITTGIINADDNNYMYLLIILDN